MKCITILTLTLLLSITSCKKSPKQAETYVLTPAALTANSWRIESVKNNVDPQNPGSSPWVKTNFERKDTVVNLYCVQDTHTNKSYISVSPCFYQIGGGAIVQVGSNDCATTVYYRDSTWSQLTRNDFRFNRGGNFVWVEQYNRSKFVNTYGKYCSPLVIVPEGIVRIESKGIWSFDEHTKTIKIDYGLEFSRLDGQTYNYFQVVSYNGNELILRFHSRTATDYRLVKQ